MPPWAKDARSLNLLQNGQTWVKQFLPEDPEQFLKNLSPKRDGDAPKDTDQPAGQKRSEAPAQAPVYGETQRNLLNSLVETTGATSQKSQSR